MNWSEEEKAQAQLDWYNEMIRLNNMLLEELRNENTE